MPNTPKIRVESLRDCSAGTRFVEDLRALHGIGVSFDFISALEAELEDLREANIDQAGQLYDALDQPFYMSVESPDGSSVGTLIIWRVDEGPVPFTVSVSSSEEEL